MTAVTAWRIEPGDLVAQADAVIGDLCIAATSTSTRCGTEMPLMSLWLAVDGQPGDRLCRACTGTPEPEQGALL